MKRCALLVIEAISLGCVASVKAEDVDAIVNRGVDLRRKGRDSEALVEFQRALRIQRLPRIQAQTALAEQALGLWESAEADLLEAIAHDSDPWLRRNRPTLDRALGVIQSRLGTLEIWGTPAGAVITVNAKPLGTLPLAKPVRVAGETALLTAQAAGYLKLSRSIRVPPGETIREHVELLPVAETVAEPRHERAPPIASALPETLPTAGPPGSQIAQVQAEPAPPSSAARPFAWAMGALALGAMGLGVTETVLAIRHWSAFQDHLGPDPSNPGGGLINDCTRMALTAACRPLANDYHQSVTLAVVGYAGAGVLAISSFLLFRLSPTKEHPDVAATCLPDVSPGASCVMRF